MYEPKMVHVETGNEGVDWIRLA